MSVFLNGRYLQEAEAVLHASDLSMQRGYAIFDFCRSVNGRVLFLDDYLDRFFASASAMFLPVRQSREELKAIVLQLVQQSAAPECGIRLFLSGGYSPDSYHPTEPNLLITCKPLKPAPFHFEKGINIRSYRHQRELPQIKTINYLTAVWLQPWLQETGADDVLYFNDQSVTEFPRSNVFAFTREGKLVTPVRDILRGITRKQVLALAGEWIEVEERDLPLQELASAQEIFASATTRKLLPVVSIDGKMIGEGHPGPLTKKLFHQFLELERKMAAH